MLDHVLDDEQRRTVLTVVEAIERGGNGYDAASIVELDHRIGGVGGYCMSANRHVNHFHGQDREMFRPLQYALIDIEDGFLGRFDRSIVEDGGIHLEAVGRVVLGETETFGKMRHARKTLGQLAKPLRSSGIADVGAWDSFDCHVRLHNDAKHEVAPFDERPHTFTTADALISFVSARIIGQQLLAGIGYPLAMQTYPVSDRSQRAQ